MEEVKDPIEEEWKKTEKRFLLNHLNKLFPLAEENSAALDNSPVLDATVVHLARNITFPMDDSMSFKDLLDRRSDSDLTKAYQAARGTCRPAIALTSVSNVIRAWTDNIETVIQQEASKEDIMKVLEELKLSADFIGEAAIDTIRCLARSMLCAVMDKRALWLKPWAASAASKHNCYYCYLVRNLRRPFLFDARPLQGTPVGARLRRFLEIWSLRCRDPLVVFTG